MPRDRRQQSQEEDRLSMLTDDILLSILGRADLKTTARTGVLSTRWMHLPWLLPELSIDVKDFLSGPCTETIEENDMNQAMRSLTKATRSFLAKPRDGSRILSLHLKLYLIDAFLCEVGPVVGDAIDNGLLKDLDITVLDETDLIMIRSDEDMLQRAQEIDTFFHAYPSVLHCLTKLSLQNADFDKLDLHHVLFDCCKQLKHLSLCCCDTGADSLFKIDAPKSNLRVLEIDSCRFERLELVCLPKLEKFICATWVSNHVPVTFGFVPSLGELELSCAAAYDHRPFKLSEILHGTPSIHTLTLDFQGEMLWLQPEMEELRTAFNKLKKLSVGGIFVEFDILWTTAFLVATPSLETLRIQVWEHACDVGEFRGGIYRDRRTPQWEMRFDGSKNRMLKELEFGGFRSLEQQFAFLRSMLERSPNLQKIILGGDERCLKCEDALDGSLRPSKFPKKDEEVMVVERIIDGKFSPEIIFDEDCSLSI